MPVVVRGCGVALLSLLIVGLVPVVEASAQCDGVLGGQSAVQACASGQALTSLPVLRPRVLRLVLLVVWRRRRRCRFRRVLWWWVGWWCVCRIRVRRV